MTASTTQMLAHGGFTNNDWFSLNALNVLNISMHTKMLRLIVDARLSSKMEQSNEESGKYSFPLAVSMPHEWKWLS